MHQLQGNVSKCQQNFQGGRAGSVSLGALSERMVAVGIASDTSIAEVVVAKAVDRLQVWPAVGNRPAQP